MAAARAAGQSAGAPAAGDPCRRHQRQGLDHRLSARHARSGGQARPRLHLAASGALQRAHPARRQAGRARGASTTRWKRSSAINAGQPITQFEITTSAALKLFAETPADYLLLEVGLGGDFDSTNVIDHPLGVIITPVDFDHQKWLGYTIAEIASHKAGILKRGAPAVIGRQRDEGLAEIERAARKARRSRPFVAGPRLRRLRAGRPAGLSGRGRPARPAAAGAGRPPPVRQCRAGHRRGAPFQAAGRARRRSPRACARVVWPARIQPLKGKLRDLLPQVDELWLDGAHNAHGAAALALSLEEMNAARPKPLVLIVGMMNTREPADFLAPFVPMAPRVLALTIPGEPNAHPAQFIADAATAAGLDAKASRSVTIGAARRGQDRRRARSSSAARSISAATCSPTNGTPPDWSASPLVPRLLVAGERIDRAVAVPLAIAQQQLDHRALHRLGRSCRR